MPARISTAILTAVLIALAAGTVHAGDSPSPPAFRGVTDIHYPDNPWNGGIRRPEPSKKMSVLVDIFLRYAT